MARNRKLLRRKRIRQGVRAKIYGTATRPRLCVFRSNKHIYAQIINDEAGHTLVSASTLESDLKDEGGSSVEHSQVVGKRLAERANEQGIDTVVFDRNVYRYHGRVKALAEGARDAGLQF
jgi:large subunit ribosomal protein L18